jgi:hypothetical protein
MNYCQRRLINYKKHIAVAQNVVCLFDTKTKGLTQIYRTTQDIPEYLITFIYVLCLVDHSGRADSGMTCLRSLER